MSGECIEELASNQVLQWKRVLATTSPAHSKEAVLKTLEKLKNGIVRIRRLLTLRRLVTYVRNRGLFLGQIGFGCDNHSLVLTVMPPRGNRQRFEQLYPEVPATPGCYPIPLDGLVTFTDTYREAVQRVLQAEKKLFRTNVHQQPFS